MMIKTLFKYFLIGLLLIVIDSKYVIANVYIAFRIDDMGIDNFNFYRKIIPIFNKYHIKLTIATVPKGFNDQITGGMVTPDDISFLKYYIDKGIVEIAQHGYSHNSNYSSRSIVSEFYGMNLERQRFDILNGKCILENIFATKISTFVPPWNSYDNNTVNIIVASGFTCLSAARFGTTANNSDGISYIPYTITYDRLQNALDDVNEDIENGNIVNGDIIVVMLHSYDFTFDNNGNLKDVDLHKLVYLLSKVISNHSLESRTIFGLSQLDINFSNKRFERSIYLKNLFTKYLLWPSGNVLITYYYKELNFFERNLFFLLAFFFYSVLVLFGFIGGLTFVKLLNSSLLKAYNVVLTVLCFLMLFLFFSGYLGGGAVVGFLISCGLLSSSFFKKVL